MHLAPHLLLRTDAGASRAGALLGSAGYLVSRVDDDAMGERLAGSEHIDGVVVELPSLAAIHFVRRLNSRYGAGGVVVLVITAAPELVRRVVPAALAITPFDVADDLISTVDLAIAARQRLIAQYPRSRAAGAAG